MVGDHDNLTGEPMTITVKPTREICDLCEGEKQLHLETPMLLGDIPNGVVRDELRLKYPTITEVCQHCTEEFAEKIDQEWDEEKSDPTTFPRFDRNADCDEGMVTW